MLLYMYRGLLTACTGGDLRFIFTCVGQRAAHFVLCRVALLVFRACCSSSTVDLADNTGGRAGGRVDHRDVDMLLQLIVVVVDRSFLPPLLHSTSTVGTCNVTMSASIL